MQQNYKKLLFFGALCAFSMTIFCEPVQEQVASRVITQSKIIEIMDNGPMGVNEYNANNIYYADVQNLEEDLDLDEIVKHFGCQTKIGAHFLHDTFRKPVSPQDQNNTIASRRHVIETLVKNPQLKNEVEDLLEQSTSDLIRIAQLIERPVIRKERSLEVVEVQHSTNSFCHALYDGLCGSFGTISTVFSVYLLNEIYQGRIDAFDSYDSRSYHRAEDQPIFVGIQSGCAGLILLGTFSMRYREGVQYRQFIHSLYQLITIAERIESLSLEYGFETQFTMSSLQESQTLMQLIQDVKYERYTDTLESSIIFTPAVHALVARIRENRDCLAPIFAAIAEMDAYYILAEKIITTQGTENSFCCVEFIDNTRPTIHAKKFWNLLVNLENNGKVVANDISEHRNIILTGPNEGGKTTGIRAILQNILFAQTFGIAAAQEFIFTQFDVIHSYLNIGDDILHGKSRFASEVKRAQDILHCIKALDPQEKFFFALDELFTGTNAEDGEACAYNFIDNIGSYPNIQFIYATHFNKLKLIGSANKLCSNYKVDAPIRTATGRFVYPYTLSQGASESYIAMDRARDAGLFK